MGWGSDALWAQPTRGGAGQKTGQRIEVLNTDVLELVKIDSIEVRKLLGNVRIRQDSILFFCDSAYHFVAENRIQAMSNVRAVLNDTMTLTADRLDYLSTERRVELYDRITLTDGTNLLRSDRMTYLRDDQVGFYRNWGTLTTDQSVIESRRGHYYSLTKDAIFRDSVWVRGTQENFRVRADSLRYNTEREEIQIICPTFIVARDTHRLYSEAGWFRSQTREGLLWDNPWYTDSSYRARADTIYFNDSLGTGWARCGVYLRTQDTGLYAVADYAILSRTTRETWLMEAPWVVQYMDRDTMLLMADTLYMRDDTLRVRCSPSADSLLNNTDRLGTLVDSLALSKTDSLGTPADTLLLANVNELDSLSPSYALPDSVGLGTLVDSLLLSRNDSLGTLADSMPRAEVRCDTLPAVTHLVAWPRVSIRMRDVTARADSLAYRRQDSLLVFYRSPILWTDANQLTGDTIAIWLSENRPDSLRVMGRSFAVEQADSIQGFFNQVKGKQLYGKFDSSRLQWVRVEGNAESLYFVFDGPALQGLNEVFCRVLSLWMTSENKPGKIAFYDQPQGIYKPPQDFYGTQPALDDFAWRVHERPPFQSVPRPAALAHDPFPPLILAQLAAPVPIPTPIDSVALADSLARLDSLAGLLAQAFADSLQAAADSLADVALARLALLRLSARDHAWTLAGRLLPVFNFDSAADSQVEISPTDSAKRSCRMWKFCRKLFCKRKSGQAETEPLSRPSD
jgi:lipopolysaccharide export system protein LptA